MNNISGRWHDIDCSQAVNITAKYDRITDFVMDSSGYFLIRIDKDNQTIQAAFCTLDTHQMKYIIKGISAIEVANTIISFNLVTSLQHAADIGIELYKAEVALKLNLSYTQDHCLDIIRTES